MLAKRRFRFFLLAVLILTPLVFALRFAYWSTLGYRFATISDGQVYQSAQMGPEVLEKTVKRHGIRSVVNLRFDDREPELAAQERAVLKRLGVSHFYLPSSQVPNLESVNSFLELASREENRPMLIHCEDGEGRAVLFAALYRIEFEDWENDDARRATRLFHFRGVFGPDGEKGRFLLDYEPSYRDGP